MADGSKVVVNHVLCFLFTKYFKCPSKLIKQSILEYYASGDIHEAKETLMLAVSNNFDISCLTKIRGRRGDGRAEHELDDIFTIITECDEKLLISQLPKFVSDNADNMPSSVIVDGDLRAVMNRFEKLESQITHLQNLVSKFSAAMFTGPQAVPPGQPGRSQQESLGIGPPTSRDPRSVSYCRDSGRFAVGNQDVMNEMGPLQLHCEWGESATTVTTGFSSFDEMSDAGQWQNSEGRRAKKAKRRRMLSEQQQATVGSLPAALQTHEPSSVLPRQPSAFNTVVERSSAVQQSGPPTSRPSHQPFVAGQSNYAAAAAKPAVKPATGNQPNRQPNQQQARPRQRLRKQVPVVVGRSRQNASNNASAQQGDLIAAAKPYINKATFCIDNVLLDVTELAMATFVAAMDIDVLGCYKTNPRRTRYQCLHKIEPKDGKTFRLCTHKRTANDYLTH